MRIAALCAPNGHYRPLMLAVIQGMERLGDEVTQVFGSTAGMDCDAFLCWGWRSGRRFRQMNPTTPVLLMERGYVGDRFHWTSLGWNGLNGRAVFPRDFLRGGSREIHIAEHMQPWRDGAKISARDGYALILGQVQGDAACVNVNLAYQYRAWAHLLHTSGYTVKFRPHPKALRQACGLPRGCYAGGTLAEDLTGAAFTVSWNSNSSVDSVLAGVPSVTLDEGAMAYAVTSHDLRNPVTMPSRTEWAAQLAWCQWQPSELADGTAWKAVREVKP